MGAFFTNIQLKNSGVDQTTFTNKVIESLITFNTDLGFIKIDNEEEADKTVIVSSSKDHSWISIYDEELETQEVKKLNKLAAELSRQFKTAALSVRVNDSDSMYLGLTINGKLADNLNNLSKEIDFDKRKPDSWSNILLKKYGFSDIKKSWQAGGIFVEEFLTEFAKFIKIDTSQLLTGYKYLNEEHPDEGIKINFAWKDKKKTAEIGLTEIRMVAGSGLIDVKSGKKQKHSWIMTNWGTFSTGLQIVISGDSIEKGLVIPEMVTASYVKYKTGNKNKFKASFVETVSTSGEKIFYVRLEELNIPEGIPLPSPVTPKEYKRFMELQYDPAIEFEINFIGKKAGTGDLTIFFTPLANREGYYSADVEVKVTK